MKAATDDPRSGDDDDVWKVAERYRKWADAKSQAFDDDDDDRASPPEGTRSGVAGFAGNAHLMPQGTRNEGEAQQQVEGENGNDGMEEREREGEEGKNIVAGRVRSRGPWLIPWGGTVSDHAEILHSGRRRRREPGRRRGSDIF